MSYTPPASDAVAFVAGPAYTPPASDAVALSDVSAQFVSVSAGSLTWTGGAADGSIVLTGASVAAGAMAWTGVAGVGTSETRAYLAADTGIWAGQSARASLLEAWNPSDLHTNLALTASNRTVAVDSSAGTTWGVVRGTKGRSTGKYYFEVVLNDDEDVAVGLARASESLTALLGSGVYGWSFVGHADPASPDVMNANVPVDTGGTIYPTNVLMVAANLDSGALWFGISGFWWSGNPATESSPYYTNLSGTLYPAASLRHTGTARSLSARFFPAQMDYAIPTGFAAWNEDLLVISVSAGSLTWDARSVYTQVEHLSAGAMAWTGVAGVGTDQPYPVLWTTGYRYVDTAGFFSNTIYTYLATHYHVAGKWYFEVALGDTIHATDDIEIGTIAFGGSTSGGVGLHDTGWSFVPSVTDPYPSRIRTNNATTDFGVLFAAGDTIDVAIDVDAGKIWFGRNGTWMGGGNPAAGTAPAFSGLPAALYPAVSVSIFTTGSRQILIGAFSVLHLRHDPPAGFARWQPSDRVDVSSGGMAWTGRDTFIPGEAVAAGAMAWTGLPAALGGASAIAVGAGTLAMTARPVEPLNGAFWNPYDRAAGLDFYNPTPGQPPLATYATTESASWQAVRGTMGRSSGRWFWRVAAWGNDGGKQEIKVGLVDALADLTAGNLGDRATEWMFELGGLGSLQNLTWFRNGGLPPYPYYYSPWPGYEYHGLPVDPITPFSETPNGAALLIAVDLNIGHLWVGSTYWDDTTDVNGRLIVSGATLVATNLTGTVYPCVSMRKQFSATVVAHGEFSGPVAYEGAEVDPDGVITFGEVPEGFNCFAGWAPAFSCPVAWTGINPEITRGVNDVSYPAFAKWLYRCILTGADDALPDLELPISSFDATRRAGEPTYLAVAVPAPANYVEGILARPNGDIVVYRVYLSDGVETSNELIRVNFESFRYDIGARSASAQLTGHKTVTPTGQQTRALTDVSYKNVSDGIRRYRCEVDMYLAPGDIASYGGEFWTVGSISYTVNANQAVMEVAEASS